MRFAKLFVLQLTMMVAFCGVAADHLVLIHGWQMLGGGSDTWDRLVQLMVTPETVGDAAFRMRDQIHVVNYNDSRSIDQVAQSVYEQITGGFPDGTDPIPAGEKIDFVVHSMGGLVLRSMVQQGLLMDSQIGHVVTLASPHYGQKFSLTLQQSNMAFGSDFIWELANTKRKISAGKVLCLAGTSDDVVKEWSASLVDSDCTAVRYVDKIHSSAFGKRAICYCSGGYSDPVYRLITGFLNSGAVSGGSASGSDDHGSVLFRVIDQAGQPIAYPDVLPIVRKVETAGGGRTSYGQYKNVNNEQGIGAVTGTTSNYGGVTPGDYIFTIENSADQTVKSFTAEDPIPVKRGRTTVTTIKAKSNAIDFVFLIDSTGSMSDDINSVKTAALKLVGQLMGGGDEVRVAVADYRDHSGWTGDSSDYPFKLITPFTENSSTVVNAINSISVGGGGDGDESLYTALYHCLNNNGSEIGGWRKASSKTVMFMTDAGAHDPDYEGHTRAEIVQLANEIGEDHKPGYKTLSAKTMLMAAAGDAGASAGVSLYPVLTTSSSSLREEYAEIAETTGGKVTESAAFDNVVEAIADVVGDVEKRNGIESAKAQVSENAGSLTLLVYGGNTVGPSSVEYWVLPGSATAGKDYKALKKYPGKLSWTPGEVGFKELTIPILSDKGAESDEMFTVVLANAVNMSLTGNTICQVTIKDENVSASLSAAVGNVGMTTKNSSGWSVAKVYKDEMATTAAKGVTAKYGKTIKMTTAFTAPSDGYFYFDVHYENGYSLAPLVVYDGKKAIGQVNPSSEDTSGWKRYYLPMLKKGKHTLTWSVKQTSYYYKTTLYLNNFFFYPEDRAIYSVTALPGDTRAGDVSGSGIYFAGTKINVSVKARPGWTFVGWVASGTTLAKPKAASQSVTVNANVTMIALFNRITYVNAISAFPGGGTVKGSAYCKSGKSVKLTATAKKGYAFTSWSNGMMTPTITVKSAEADALAVDGVATYVASFRKITEIEKPVLNAELSFRGMVGVDFEAPLPYESECRVTYSAKSLPKGLKVSGDCIKGVPAKAGDYKVTVSGKNAAGSSSIVIAIKIDPFPTQLVGAFNGFVTDPDDRIVGSYSATVASSGKISAKVVSSNGVSFTSASWASYEDDVLTACLSAKGGRALDLAALATDEWRVFQKVGRLDSRAELLSQMNRWSGKDADGNPIADELVDYLGTYDYRTANGETLALSIGAKGVVKGALGKRSFSTTLLADEDSRFAVIYLAADKKKKYPEFSDRVEFVPQPGEAEPGSGVAYRKAGVRTAGSSLDGIGTGTITATPAYGQAAAGAKAKLVAKPSKKSAFVKWVVRDADGNVLVSDGTEYLTTLNYVMDGVNDIWAEAIFRAKSGGYVVPEITYDEKVFSALTVGERFEQILIVPEEARPVQFSVKKLPAGLKLNTTTGVISGTPTAEGAFAIDITAKCVNDKAKVSTVPVHFEIHRAGE